LRLGQKSGVWGQESPIGHLIFLQNNQRFWAKNGDWKKADYLLFVAAA